MLAAASLAALSLAIAASAAPHAPPRSLLITKEGPHADASSCLRYAGAYGSVAAADHVYLATDGCLESSTSGFAGGHISAPLDEEARHTLVWVGEAGVQGAPRGVVGVWEALEAGARMLHAQHVSVQTTFNVYPTPSLIAETASALILSVPDLLLPQLDLLLPGHLSAVAIPTDLAPIPVKQELLDNLTKLTKHLKFSAEIDEIVSGLDDHQLVKDVRWLTGESSDIETRHSFAADTLRASEWIRAKVQDTGAQCTIQPFRLGFAPNVICTYPSTTNSTDMVIISSHYDSRGSFGRIRAPGADDDGSGTGQLLAIAQAIYTQKVRFREEVTLAFFAGEEQGLFGSAAFAKQLHADGRKVLMQVQSDMLGFHDPKEPMQLGFPATIGTIEVAHLIGNISHLYSPQLVVGTTAACCSDHQSFLPYGFPATQLFERNGPIIDPRYHNSGDLSLREGFDFDQIIAIAKVNFASLLTVAGYERAK